MYPGLVSDHVSVSHTEEVPAAVCCGSLESGLLLVLCGVERRYFAVCLDAARLVCYKTVAFCSGATCCVWVAVKLNVLV